jgi:phospholipid-binding lipoprotein MlaA
VTGPGRLLLIGVAIMLVTGCAASQAEYGSVPPKRRLSDIYVPGEPGLFTDVPDPWEGFNRRMYDLNARLDRHLLVPVVEGSKRYTPSFMRAGIRNFFRNLLEISNFYNSVLQGRPGLATRVAGRFVVNSTLGLFGLLDPASQMGLPYQREDLGQTLGRWGIGPGPYLVLPVFGPSTLRDGFGLAAGTLITARIDPTGYYDWSTQRGHWWTYIVWGINERARVDFRYYETGSPFEYLLVRRLYLDFRELEIAQ